MISCLGQDAMVQKAIFCKDDFPAFSYTGELLYPDLCVSGHWMVNVYIEIYKN